MADFPVNVANREDQLAIKQAIEDISVEVEGSSGLIVGTDGKKYKNIVNVSLYAEAIPVYGNSQYVTDLGDYFFYSSHAGTYNFRIIDKKTGNYAEYKFGTTPILKSNSVSSLYNKGVVLYDGILYIPTTQSTSSISVFAYPFEELIAPLATTFGKLTDLGTTNNVTLLTATSTGSIGSTTVVYFTELEGKLILTYNNGAGTTTDYFILTPNGSYSNIPYVKQPNLKTSLSSAGLINHNYTTSTNFIGVLDEENYLISMIWYNTGNVPNYSYVKVNKASFTASKSLSVSSNQLDCISFDEYIVPIMLNNISSFTYFDKASFTMKVVEYPSQSLASHSIYFKQGEYLIHYRMRNNVSTLATSVGSTTSTNTPTITHFSGNLTVFDSNLIPIYSDIVEFDFSKFVMNPMYTNGSNITINIAHPGSLPIFVSNMNSNNNVNYFTPKLKFSTKYLEREE